MEVILAIPSLERTQELMAALGMRDVDVRAMCVKGSEVAGHVARGPVEGIVMLDELPDGTADLHLRDLRALPGPRPAVVVLVYQRAGLDTTRSRIRDVYGWGAEVVFAGSRPAIEVAAEIALVLDRLTAAAESQERDAHERLSRPAADGSTPRPHRRSGIAAFVGISGGVGTSTLVANLAATAALRSALQVVVVDAQLGTGPTVLHQLGALDQDGPEAPGLHLLRYEYEASRGRVSPGLTERLREVMIPVTMKGLRHPPIRVLQVPQEVQNRVLTPAPHILWAARSVHEAGDADVVLMDCGSGIGHPRTQELLREAAQVFLVATNGAGGLNTLQKSLPFIAAMEWTVSPHLLLRTTAGSAFTESYVRRLTRMPILALLPQEEAILRRDGQQSVHPPMATIDRSLGYCQEVENLALKMGLLERTERAVNEPRGLFRWVRR